MDIRLSRLLIVALLLSIMEPGPVRAASSQGYHQYHAAFEPSSLELKVRACFSGKLPTTLTSVDSNAADYLTSVETEHERNRPGIRHGKIYLGSDNQASCVRYTVDVSGAARGSEGHRYQSHIVNDTVTRSGTWLWLPENNTLPVEIEFSFPEGAGVSSPWRMGEQSAGAVTYRIDPRSYDGSGHVVFGGFSEQVVHVPGARLRIAVLEGRPSADVDKLTVWIRRGAEAMIRLYGEFPLEQVQILVFPIGKYTDSPDASPVPWGEIKRGGGSAVHLYVDDTRPLSELVSDWTLYHEMSHLFHPYIDMEGRWLSEGVATYYQNVLQARAGVLSEKRAWQKLHDGFQRGIKETRRGRNLNDVSRNMYKNRQYMRVYWSGTAVAILADVYLRQTNRGSLDQALYRFRDCCLPSARTWTAREFMTKLDSLMDTDIFMSLYQRYAHSDRFPDLADIYDSLGLSLDSGRVDLDKTADRADIRDTIMEASST